MRMRRLKWAADFLANSDVVVHDPSNQAGKWRDLLKREELHIEIGTGKGDYWIGMSEKYPSIGWVGIEKQESVAALAVRKSGDFCENRRFLHADANALETYFGKEEVDVIHLNFSDPWPKNRNSKRRLSHAGFIEKYKMILKREGSIQMKTDNAALFEFSVLEFLKQGFLLEEFSVDFRRVTHEEDVISEYERKFMEKVQPIYRCVFKK